MTSDERVLQHVADANPIPDPQVLVLRPLESVDLTTTRRRRAMKTAERDRLDRVPGTTRRLPRWAIAVAAAFMALAVVGGVILGLRALTGGDDVADDGSIEPALGVAVPIGERARSVVAIDGTLYALVGDGTIVRFDPATGTLTGEMPDVMEWGGNLVVYEGSLWLSAGGGGLIHIDPDRLDVIETVPVAGETRSLAAGHGSIWTEVIVDEAATDTEAAVQGGPDLVRIDPDTHEIIATIPGAGAADIAATSDAMWVATASGGYVTFQRIDPATNQISRVVTWQPGTRSQVTDPRLVVVDGRLWGAVTTIITADDELGELVEGGLYRITDDDRVELWTSLGRWPAGVVQAGGSVWVTDCFDGTLTQLDTATGAVQGSPQRIGIPAPDEFDWFYPEGFTCPTQIEVLGDTLWIVASVDGSLIPVYLDPTTAPGPTVTIPLTEP